MGDNAYNVDDKMTRETKLWILWYDSQMRVRNSSPATLTCKCNKEGKVISPTEI